MDSWIRGNSVGHGSTATVSLATSFHSAEIFAVKSAELSLSEFLQREQKILSSVASPHIVSYRGCDITRENNKVMYNLFLEYMSGGSLVDTIQAHGGRLGESMIGYYTCQIVQGLDYLHSNGLVHCDIKSSNILIGDAGAKIADFGCAKRVVATVDVAETIGGTPMFMAPEVARGAEQGFASDIWALGCTIIEMATGCAPWPNANDPVSVMYRIGFMDQLPEFPCCLSEQAKDFLEKCLRRDPKQRWTANQLLKHPFLEKFISHGKQIQEPNNSGSSYSPTSILDQHIWNSVDDESENLDNLAHSCHHDHESSPSASERIRRLCLVSEGPSWELDENWIPVRGNCSEEGDTIMDGIEVKNEVASYGSVYQENYCGGGEQWMDGVLTDKNIISSRISGDILGDCKYGKDSFLVCSNLRLDRDRNVLLIPYISILLSQA
ncbi:Mitogen-activated protein kinase kinase kinase, putative [Ricinus communis]|uniref:mitogen-activated protein kinase kinase kinase n=2 Tax=Ricinus communis TaxID=3988 RepID=B9SFR7_RICCO|nr:Mitogen-activated protein kinase kinase kinase, putative [Ricinus communis]